MFLELAKAYGWRPTEIAALTPAQLDLYLDALRESGICWMSPTELRAWRRRGANDEES